MFFTSVLLTNVMDCVMCVCEVLKCSLLYIVNIFKIASLLIHVSAKAFYECLV